MAIETEQIIENVLMFSPAKKASLIDRLLSSLDQPDEHTDVLWRKEVEDRIRAYRAGQIESVSLEEVMSKYHK